MSVRYLDRKVETLTKAVRNVHPLNLDGEDVRVLRELLRVLHQFEGRLGVRIQFTNKSGIGPSYYM